MLASLNDLPTRLLTSSYFIGAGAVAAAMGNEAGVAGFIAAQLASIAASILATDAHNLATKRPKKPAEILANHDLVKAVGLAIQAVISEEANSRHLASDLKSLREIAKIAPERWELLSNPLKGPLTELSEENLPAFFSTKPEDFAKLTALDPRTWNNFLTWSAEDINRRISEEAAATVAQALYVGFPSALREIIKRDFETGGKAYAGLQLLIQGEIRASISDLSGRLEVVDSKLMQWQSILHFLLEKQHDELKSLIASIKQSQVGPQESSLPPVLWKLPPKNPNFLDPLNLVKALGKKPILLKRLALCGMPGVGKTQAVLAYAHASNDKKKKLYTATFLINAESTGTVASELAQIIRGLRIPARSQAGLAENIELLKNWMDDPANSGWLLILDNANDIALTRSIFPTAGNGRIIITTNNVSMRNLVEEFIELRPLDEDTGAYALLLLAGILREGEPLDVASPENQAASRALSREFGGLFLAIAQAAAFILECSNPVEYFEIYRKDRKEFQKKDHDLSHASVAITFGIALNKIEQTQPAAADLLRLCSLLNPDSIPEEILEDGASHLGHVLANEAADDSKRLNIIQLACRYSLMRRDPSARLLSIHGLVNAVIRDQMPARLLQTWFERAVKAVDSSFSLVDMSRYRNRLRVAPHAIACVDHSRQFPDLAFAELGSLCYKSASFLASQQQYVFAERLFRQAISIYEANPFPDPPAIARCRSELAGAIHNHDLDRRGGEVEANHCMALESRVASFGENSLEAARSYNFLGTYYRDCSPPRFEEARRLFLKAMRITRANLGRKDPDAADSMAVLGTLYEMSDPVSAERWLSRAIMRRVPLFPPGGGDLAQAWYILHLGLALGFQGRHEDAEIQMRRALQICEQDRGEDHPAAVFYYFHCINNLFAQNRVVDALVIAERMISLFRRHEKDVDLAFSWVLVGTSHVIAEKAPPEDAWLLISQAMTVMTQLRDSNDGEVIRLSTILDEVAKRVDLV